MTDHRPLIFAALAVTLLVATAKPSSLQRNSGHIPCIRGDVTHNNFVQLPPAYRQHNYGPSCGWATTIMLCRAQGLYKEADWLRANRSGPSGPWSINPTLTALGIPYAFTIDGDERLLDWALLTNRGCGIGYPTMHATMLVGKKYRGNAAYAIVLDNNHTERYTEVPWDDFLRGWRGCGGWAWAIIPANSSPPPETPTLKISPSPKRSTT
jgi:hypothetical protein